MLTTFSLLALVSLPAAVLANFRIECAAVSHERLDPIVSPGAVSGHVHGLFGGSAIAPTVSAASMRRGQTSCEVKQDKSAYWTPDLYFQWKNGSFSMVPGESLTAYYYTAGYEKEILPMPAGLRMLSGSPWYRSYIKAPSQEYGAVNYACIGSGMPDTDYLPNYDCPAGIRADVYFPSCWDGKNLDSADHISHVAYASNVVGGGDGEGDYSHDLPGNGKCPSTHPKRFISLSVSRFFDTSGFDSSQAKNSQAPYVFAMGDNTGYGMHADVFSAWDGNTLARAIKECTFKDGYSELCAPFTIQNITQYDEPYASLVRKTPTVNEAVYGPLTKLPGCNPVTSGPKTATPAKCSAKPPSFFRKPQVYSGPVPPVGAQLPSDVAAVLPSYKKFKYAGCYSDRAKTSALPLLKTNNKMTPQMCMDLCASKKLTYCGLEENACHGGNKLASTSKAQDLGVCYSVCPGSLNYCGGQSSMTVYKTA